jgi:hypothetical protein
MISFDALTETTATESIHSVTENTCSGSWYVGEYVSKWLNGLVEW